jgi:putative aldouronate transport system substrate-binding protein
LHYLITRHPPEHRELANKGIESIHHKMENGKVVKTDQHKADSVGHWYVMFNAKARDAEDFIQESVDRGSSEADLKRMREMSEFAAEKIKEANLQLPHWSVESPTYFDKWGNVIKDLNDNKILVITGKMSIDQWDKYVKSVVESKDYQAILKEFKEGYKK